MCDVNEMCTKNLKPKLLDLFCGTKSVAHAALNLGFEVTTLDIDARCKHAQCQGSLPGRILAVGYVALSYSTSVQASILNKDLINT